MPSHVTVNGLGLTYKGTVGISTATLPDVCKTPSPGGPVPLPYPNIAIQSSLKAGTTTVKAKGKMIAVKGSQYGRSNGDEPGTAGGVKSGVHMKATDWITYSFDVKIDGKNACRHTDKKFHNNKNTVDLAGNIDPVKPAGLSPADSKLWDDCKAQHDKYKKMQNDEAAHRAGEYTALIRRPRDALGAGDKKKLFQIAFEKAQMVEGVIAERVKYVKMGCDQFDWFNEGRTTSERKKSHDDAISQTHRYLANLKELKNSL